MGQFSTQYLLTFLCFQLIWSMHSLQNYSNVVLVLTPFEHFSLMFVNSLLDSPILAGFTAKKLFEWCLGVDTF